MSAQAHCGTSGTQPWRIPAPAVASTASTTTHKNHLVEWLKEAGHEPVDCGPHIYDAQDDYPPFCLRAAERTAADPEALGIVIGGSGNGEQIAANKVKGVRAVLAWSEQTAALGREHNNANVVAVGARMHSTDEAVK